jgi:peptidoglycan-N-acetylglucosamine deacetylase
MFKSPFFLPWLYTDLIWKIPNRKKKLYLTFDDGPVPEITEFVLTELEKVKAKATFFCIGDNVRKHPDVFGKIVKAGHTIGNHTFNHLKGWNTSVKTYVENVKLCDKELIIDNCQLPGSLFRPPYGRITRSQIKALKDYKIIMWDVLTHDYSKNISPDRCLKGSVAATRPGSIIVFHDSLKAEKNMSYALPRFLDHFANNGFIFEGIPTLPGAK